MPVATGREYPSRDLRELDHLRAYNRMRLLAWLRVYSDRHEPGYTPGFPNFGGKWVPGPRSPLSERMLRRLDDKEGRACDRILDRAVDRLRRERIHLWTCLCPAYFAEDANPTLVDKWQEQKHRSAFARSNLDAHEEAIAFMQEYAESELRRVGLNRLKVDAPWWYPGGVRPPKPLQVAALEWYYSYLEADPRNAARKAAEEVGYSPEGVRRLVARFEGAVTPRSGESFAAARRSSEVDGVRLKELRREREMTQEDLGRVSGVTPFTISRLERGKRRASVRTVMKLAEALTVEPEHLVADGTHA